MQSITADRGLTRPRDWLVALALTAIAFAAFVPALDCGFIGYDDPYYVYANPNVAPGCSVAGLRWAFTTFDFSYWHPLTWLSLQVDATIWRTASGALDARGFHLTSILIHAANTGLLFLALRALTGVSAASAATAILFAIHPLRVQSVAWISERKDVLSVFFGLLTLLAWARYVAKPSLRRYLLAALALALSLMSKPMLVTLPALLLVLDWWPLERVTGINSWPRLVAEKLPLFLLVAISALVTSRGQGARVTTHSAEVSPPIVRIENAAVSYVAYLEKTVWPTHLAFFYPHPGESLSSREGAAAAILWLAMLTVAAAMLRRRAPYLLAGWLWYLGTLVPVIGLIQVGDQAMADRYSYFPQIGLLLALCYGVAALLTNYQRLIIPVLALPALALVVATFYQLRLWHDPLALFERSLATTGPSRTIYECLAGVHEDRGEFDEAEACFRKALELEPEEVLTLTGLGSLLLQRGRLDEAAEVLEKARDIAPAFPLPHLRLESVYLKQAKLDKAEAELVKYRELVPDSPESYRDLGTIYLRQGKIAEAAQLFRKACQLAPGASEGYMNLGLAEEKLGDFAAAAESYATALRLRPNFHQARAGLGVALSRLGRREEGLAQLRAAVQAQPDFVQGYVLLGKALANAGDLEGSAVHLAEAARLDPKLASAWHDLALVQLRLGRKLDAAESRRRAAELDPRLGLPENRPAQ
jgi:protein O-mannosyl-transferase